MPDPSATDRDAPASPLATPHPAEEIIDRLIEHAQSIGRYVQPGRGEYHLRSLVKVYRWALDQQPVAAGDLVTLADDIDLTNAPSWRPYAHLLVKGATGRVESVEFNGSHEVWQAYVRFDAGEAEGLFALGPHRLIRGCSCNAQDAGAPSATRDEAGQEHPTPGEKP